MKTSQNIYYKEKLVALPYMFFGMFFFLIICILGLVMVSLIISKQSSRQELFYTLIFGNLLFTLFPVILLIIFFKDLFSIVTIDKNGVHKSLFKKYYKQDIAWDKLNSMMLMRDFRLHLYFSKNDLKKLIIMTSKTMRMSSRWY